MEIDDSIFVQSIARGMCVLEVFSSARGPMSLSEIAAAAGTNKSAAQRICHTLLTLGYLERAEGGGLLPGRRLLERSFDYLRLNPLVERATPILVDLRQHTDERVDLSLFDGTTLLYVLRNHSKRETQGRTVTGRRVPTFSTAGGRAILARLSNQRVREILDQSDRKASTPYTITSVPEILKKVQEARKSGYSFAVQETLVGEITVAAAVVDHDNSPLGAVHVAGSLSDWKVQDFIRRFSPLVVGAARAISSPLSSELIRSVRG
jgi:IclR family transcriptional regulator, pca regulon regulatory protein